MRKTLLVFLLVAGACHAAVTNWKCGIDVTYSGTAGTDYQEEYYYHNRKVGVAKSVWIKDATTITMAHNARNVASTNGRPKVVVGTGANKGAIRYGIDKMWANFIVWDSAENPTYYPAYTAPFSLSTQEYETGVPVVGTTGSNGFAQTDRTHFYWRGITDSVGDEWHVFKYADDDHIDYPLGGGDTGVSDGNWFMLCVNPITPCLTMDAHDATGQYYTTPAYVYLVNRINAVQTTYFQGAVDVTLTNIYGGNISYDINGGSTVNVGAVTVTLTQASFTTGTNTLRYWYTATPSVKRTRTLVKNPVFPSAGETHGNLLWKDSAGLAVVTARIARSPYATTYATYSTAGGSGQDLWDSNGGNGYRLGGEIAAWQQGFALTNAFQAQLLGFTAIRSGASKSYADYAREMLVESGLTTPQLGFEIFATLSQASAELNYRGYTDVSLAYQTAFAYDILIANYRSDQGYANGITPVEDYFIRDNLAGWVVMNIQWIGAFQQIGQGLWGTARATGAMACALAMPGYSTPHLGTSGVDGTTTTYVYTPFEVTNYIWKDIFITRTNSLGSYPLAPVNPMGWEDAVDDLGLTNNVFQWTDNITYLDNAQQGYNLAIYRNFQAMYYPALTHTNLDGFLNLITKPTPSAYYLKDPPNTPPPFGPARNMLLGVLNSNFPVLASNATAAVQALSSGNVESAPSQIGALGIWAFLWYDDTFYGNGSGGDSFGGKVVIGGKVNAQ